jgi:hypothetical protein
MRGDLVYEKLGEIDPALVAEALPEAAPMPELYHLGGNNPPPPKKRPNFRKALVVCACLLLAGVLLVGGGVVMSRSGVFDLIFPSTEPPIEVETDDPNARYKGTVTICSPKNGETIPVGGDPRMDALAMDIKKMLNSICESEPSSPTYTAGDYILYVGDTEIWLTVSGDRYLFMKDPASGEEWRLTEETAQELHELIQTVYESDHVNTDLAGVELIYEQLTLHPNDAYEVRLNYDPKTIKVERVYLRHLEQTDYTIGQTAITIRQGSVFYMPEDAPEGSYEAVAEFRINDSEILTVKSPTICMNLRSAEKSPAYDFHIDIHALPVTHYGMLEVDASVTNLGDDLYVFGENTALQPQVRICTRRHGETVTYYLKNQDGIEDGNQVRYLPSGKDGGMALFTLHIDDTVPIGRYDLILSYRGYEEVYEGAVHITDRQEYPIVLSPGESYRFPVDYTDSEYYLELFEYLIPMEIQDGYAVVTIPEDAEGGYYFLWERYNGEDTLIMYEFVYVPEKR